MKVETRKYEYGSGGKKPAGNNKWTFLVEINGYWEKKIFTGFYIDAEEMILDMAKKHNYTRVELREDLND